MDRSSAGGIAPAAGRTGHAPFLLLVVGAFAFLTVARMAQPGMFLDGVIYAAVSRNFGNGLGTFWVPYFTATDPQFFEQLPLVFALQGLAFRVFGDHLAVERAYSLVMGGLTLGLVVLAWRGTGHERKYGWLPVLFWLLPSTVTWSIVNNMLETTQAAFSTAAVLAFIKSVQSGRMRHAWAALAGLATVAACLAKGPVGFFPLAAPVIAAVCIRSRAAAALQSGVTMAAMTVAVAALLIWPQTARVSLRAHWAENLAPSVSGARGGGRWSSLWMHLNGAVGIRMGGLVVLGWIYSRFWKRAGGPREAGAGSSAGSAPESTGREALSWTWFFLLLALAGSIPIAASARIMGSYLVPSMPLYALGCAGLFLRFTRPGLDRLCSRRRTRAVALSLGLLLLVGAVALPVFRGPFEPRDREEMAEYRELAPSMPTGVTMGTCEGAREAWGLHAYLQRFFRVSLDPESGQAHRFFLQMKDRDCGVPPACRLSAGSRRLALFDCGGG
jgi:4-amino-4-deoxy-L-arabinose transferase-like glycosyltransferase